MDNNQLGETNGGIWDWIVIGTGMGGSTFGHALAKAGRRVLFIEKGADRRVNRQKKSGNYLESLIPNPLARSEEDYRNTGRSHTKIWDATRGRWLKPILGSGTGGSSALYGMVMERFWKEDFEPGAWHTNSKSALPDRWPVSFEEMESFYKEAERLFRVSSLDTDPLRADQTFQHVPRPPLPKEGALLMATLQAQGLHPYTLPLARTWGTPCSLCQSFLCDHDCKNDGAKICLEPALQNHGASLLSGAEVLEITADANRVTGVKVQMEGRTFSIEARHVALAAGALLSPVLLLKSRSSQWPQGLANQSGLVGRNLMRHYIELIGVRSRVRPEEKGDQKEIGLNDFYVRQGKKFGTLADFGAMPPLSVIMEDIDHDVAVLGRLQKAVWGLIRPLARWVLERIVQRYRFLALIIEDLPFMENRVEPGLGGADIMIHSSVRSEEWSRIRQARTLVRKALGRWATILLSNAKNTKLLAHACGTCRMGNDPQTSVVDRFNRAHGVENLYVVDSSFFPSSGGVNPALTIAANALRVAQHIIDTQADAPGTQTSMAFPSTAEPTPPAGEKTLVDLFQENTVTHSQNTFRQYKTTDGSWVSGSPALAPEMEPPVPVRPLSPSQTWGPGETQRRKEGRPRVLFVAEAVALSHPARLLEIARGLDPETYEIHFASDPRYRNVLGPVNFFTHDIESIPSAEFDRTVARGGVFFTEQVIERYVQQERFLFNKIRPDIVVGEFRPSLGISARVAGVPYVSVLNAYYNPTAQVRHVLPEYPLTEWIPQRIGQGLYNLLRSWGYARHGRPVNAVRRRHGLPPLEGDLRHALADADWTLFPDLKRLFPNSALAKNHRFMAPVFWSPNVPLPKWWDRLPMDRPVVYANLGSSGRNGVLQRVLNALSALPITVIAATAGRQPGLTVPANAFITNFLPGQDAARRSDLVITNGGNMSGYQALAEGKPIVGLASNVDQFLNMAALEDARVGKLLRAGSFSSQDLQTAVQGLMSDRTVRETAESVSVEIAVASNRVFQNILDKVLSPIPQKKENPTHEKELSRLHSF